MAVIPPALVTFHSEGGRLVYKTGCNNPTNGDIPYYDNVTGRWINLPTAASNTVLTSNGVGNAPTYQSLASLYTNTFGKTIFVDVGHERAQDTPRTGISKYDMNIPYITLAAAMTAAASGDTIILYPGTYTLGATLTVKNGVSIFGYGELTTIQGRLEFTSGALTTSLYNIRVTNTNDLAIYVNVSATTYVLIKNCNLITNYTTQVDKFTVQINNGFVDIIDTLIENTSTNTGATSNRAGIVRISGTSQIEATLDGCDFHLITADPNDSTNLFYDTNTATNTTVRLKNNDAHITNTATTPIANHFLYTAESHNHSIEIDSSNWDISWANTLSGSLISFATIGGGSSSNMVVTSNRILWTTTISDSNLYVGRSSGSNDNLRVIDCKFIYTENVLGRRFYVSGDVGLYDHLNLNNLSGVAFGRPESPKSVSMGGGNYLFDGMLVYTTDNTASGVSDGGNITDVTNLARTDITGTFTFQGTTANHTILIGSELQTVSGFLKFWGMNILNTTRAVEIVKRSFVFELWNGAAWVSFNVMALQTTNLYRYSNEVFTRASNDEVISFGILPSTTWSTKTISGKTAHWIRIRITNNLTTSPVFNSFRLASSIYSLSKLGIDYRIGSSRYFDYYPNTSGNWGTSGTINGSFAVGSGGSPTGWTHITTLSRLNGDGDYLNANFIIPPGADTSLPVSVSITYYTNTVSSSNMGVTVSFLPNEVVGTYVADPAGGITPTQRTEANSEIVTSKVAQSVSITSDNNPAGYVRKALFSNFNISNYYEGDIILCRFRLDSRNGGTLDILSYTIKIGKLTVGEVFSQI